MIEFMMVWECLGWVDGGVIFWDGEFRNRFCGEDDDFSVEMFVVYLSYCLVDSFNMGLVFRGEICVELDLGWLAWRY